MLTDVTTGSRGQAINESIINVITVASYTAYPSIELK